MRRDVPEDVQVRPNRFGITVRMFTNLLRAPLFVAVVSAVSVQVSAVLYRCRTAGFRCRTAGYRCRTAG